jgi:hypothetical protein
VSTPAPAPHASEPSEPNSTSEWAPHLTMEPTSGAARTSRHLRHLLREIDHSGSGSAYFWLLFWASFSHLTDADLVRVLQAVGNRASPQFRAVIEWRFHSRQYRR